MLKRLQSVSMVLFLGTLFSGTISTATASGANSFATTQQAGICKGLVKDATGESVIGASVVVKGTTTEQLPILMVILASMGLRKEM